MENDELKKHKSRHIFLGDKKILYLSANRANFDDKCREINCVKQTFFKFHYN